MANEWLRAALARDRWTGPALPTRSAWTIFGCPNLSIALHSTVLYNSILRFDDQMLVNPHIYSMPAFRAPIIHLRRIQGGPLFQTYVECFDRIWAESRPFDPETAG